MCLLGALALPFKVLNKDLKEVSDLVDCSFFRGLVCPSQFTDGLQTTVTGPLTVSLKCLVASCEYVRTSRLAISAETFIFVQMNFVSKWSYSNDNK